MSAPVGLSPFVTAVLVEYDRINPPKGLLPESELEYERREYAERHKKDKFSAEDDIRVAGTLRKYEQYVEHPLNPLNPLDPHMLRCTLDYAPTMLEWVTNAGIVNRTLRKGHLTAINGSARERLKEFDEAEREKELQQRGKVITESVRKAEEEHKRAADAAKSIGEARQKNRDAFTVGQQTTALEVLGEAARKLKEAQTEQHNYYDLYLTYKGRLKTATEELIQTGERLDQLGKRNEERDEKLSKEEKEKKAKLQVDLRARIGELRFEIDKLEEDISALQKEFSTNVRAETQGQESSTARLMRHVFQTVLTSSAVTPQRKVEIFALANEYKPILEKSKTKLQRIAIRVQDFVVALLNNACFRLLLGVAAVVVAIKLYILAYSLFQTYVIATAVPKLTVFLINNAPAVVVKVVNSVIGVNQWIWANQLELLAFRYFALSQVRAYPRMHRLVDRVTNWSIYPIRYLGNVFIHWPMAAMGSLAGFSVNVSNLFARNLSAYANVSKTRLQTREEREATVTWMHLTQPRLATA